MNYQDGMRQLQAHRVKISRIREEIRAIQAATEPEEVDDYEFAASEGPVRMSELFSGHRELIIVHNMGRTCRYCTLWADGYNGIYPHLENRAAFVLTTPDAPEVQKEFANQRGWRFPMVSRQGTSFAEDMGYTNGDRFLPGLSVFRMRGAGIVRVSDSSSSPGDDYCALWHIFDLIPEGPDGWQPRFEYASAEGSASVA